MGALLCLEPRMPRKRPPPEIDVDDPTESEVESEYVRYESDDQQIRLEASRHSNEVLALLRSGVPLREAWSMANESFEEPESDQPAARMIRAREREPLDLYSTRETRKRYSPERKGVAFRPSAIDYFGEGKISTAPGGTRGRVTTATTVGTIREAAPSSPAITTVPPPPPPGPSPEGAKAEGRAGGIAKTSEDPSTAKASHSVGKAAGGGDHQKTEHAPPPNRLRANCGQAMAEGGAGEVPGWGSKCVAPWSAKGGRPCGRFAKRFGVGERPLCFFHWRRENVEPRMGSAAPTTEGAPSRDAAIGQLLAKHAAKPPLSKALPLRRSRADWLAMRERHVWMIQEIDKILASQEPSHEA